ncbi:MAG: hypothetical protein K0S61_3942, partial [Anaerocolumna sp.]|nr:hypothetical protein [Anaerocolumna sp.]
TSIIGIVGTPFVMFNNAALGIIQLGTGVAAFGIGLLLGMATIYLSKQFFVTTKKLNSMLLLVFKKRVVLS